MKINHNLSAVVANDNLMINENRLTTALERLSSGLKINSAKDSPTGMALSIRMQAQIDGLNRAENNAEDGISLIQTADGALNEVTEMLQRMRELSIQAANGTNSLADRESIQDEIDALVEEIDRISKDTEFNGTTIFDGSMDTRVYTSKQEYVRETEISAEVRKGKYAVNVTVDPDYARVSATDTTAAGYVMSNLDDTTAAGVEGTLTINDVGISIDKGDTQAEIYLKIRDAAEQAGAVAEFGAAGELQIRAAEMGSDVSLTISSDQSIKNYLGLTYTDTVSASGSYTRVSSGQDFTDTTPLGKAGTLTVNGQVITVAATDGLKDIADKIKGAAAAARVTVTGGVAGNVGLTIQGQADESLKISGDHDIIEALNLTYENETAITLGGTDAVVELTDGFNGTATAIAEGGKVTISDMDGFKLVLEVEQGATANSSAADPIEVFVTGIGTMTLQIGANEGQTIEVKIPDLGAEALGVDKLNLLNDTSIMRAINKLDDAISKISSARSALGAYENRLEHTSASLGETVEDMTTALSRITDVDMAEEMSEYTNLQVLTQAGTSVLAQANQIPEQVLQMLQ